MQPLDFVLPIKEERKEVLIPGPLPSSILEDRLRENKFLSIKMPHNGFPKLMALVIVSGFILVVVMSLMTFEVLYCYNKIL
jgi:hypothetical protein